jgi:hypothetical protein
MHGLADTVSSWRVMRTLAIAAAMYLFDWPWAERLGDPSRPRAERQNIAPRSEMMRVMLYEAAQSMLRSKKWSWLKAWAMQIARRRGFCAAWGMPYGLIVPEVPRP